MKIRFLQGAILRFTFCLFVLLTPLAMLHAQDTLAAGTPYNIVNENSSSCIGASGQATANGTAVQQYVCANGTYSSQLSQQWIFTSAGSGYYEVADANATGESWNVVSNGTANGSLIQIWSYGAASNEEWEPVSLGGGYYEFVGKGSGLCLDTPSNSTANGLQYEIYTCNGTTAQAFKLVTPTASSCTSAPSAPTGLAASGTSSSGTTLSWADTAPANCSISSYTILENGISVGTATGTSFAVNGLSASTTYSFTVEAADGAGTSSASSVLTVSTPASGSGEGPYPSAAAAVPGTVLAENYDTGGQGVGYNVTSTNGSANTYRSQGVDLEAASSPATGNDLGWSAAGQWFRYTVNVATAGTYTVSFVVASPTAVTDAFHISNSSGTNLSGSVNVPATGGYQTWVTVTASVTLPAGTQTLTLNEDAAGWNIDSMAFAGGSSSSCASAPSAPTGLSASGTSSSGTTLNWTGTAPANCSISSYTILKNGASIGTATGTSFAVSGLAASTTYSFTVEATDSKGTSPASSVLTVSTSASSSGEAPYGGTPAAVPGAVMAENYDTGDQGIGYSVTSINGSNNGYRSDGVDLEVATSPATGNDLGWSATGQWFKYTVNVSIAGTYTISFLVSNGSGAAVTDAFHISNSSGTNLTGSVAVPNTSGWQTWTTVTATVTLPAGVQTLTLNEDNGGWNFDSMTFASGSGGSTGKIFAPYEYVGDLSDADQIAPIVAASGAKAVILAFLDPDNNGCSLIWPGANGALPNDKVGSTSMGTVIADMQAAGVTVIISGGGAGALDGSAYCGTAAEVQSLYQSVITQYHVKWLDFDIESTETSGQPTRRAQALAALQVANPGLIISYTLPLGSDGLDSGSNGGTTDITDAKSAGLNLNIVNGMAMDFGGTNTNQPALSESGAAALKAQIQAAGLTSTVGLTFLPGTSDDDPPNYFTLANATTMVNFANSNSYITLLSFWELNRDNGGCSGSTSDEDNCSGVSQSDYEFSSIFGAF